MWFSGEPEVANIMVQHRNQPRNCHNFYPNCHVYQLRNLSQSVYVESRTERIFAIACLGKKLVLQSEISSYSLILFSKI